MSITHPTPLQPEMKIIFLGTGEACDPHRRNTSVLVESSQRQILLDCGFSSAQAYFDGHNRTRLDIIWISHLHGDHFFGIPHLIVHFYIQGRTDELIIASGFRCQERIIQAIDLAYPNLSEKLKFKLRFQQIAPDTSWYIDDITINTAPVAHSQDSFGVKINANNRSLYYSGDGKATRESTRLMNGSDLVIHEAYTITPTMVSHCSIEECLQLAESEKIKKLALVHVNVETRHQLKSMDHPPLSPPQTELLIPEDGDIIILD